MPERHPLRTGRAANLARRSSGSIVADPPSGGDDTAMLQAALDEARTNGYGEVVLQQNAVYLIDGLRPNGASGDQKSIRLRGEGAFGYQLGTATLQASTILRRLPSAVAAAGIISEGHGFDLENVTLDGNAVSGHGFMLDVLRGFELKLRHVRAMNAPSGAIRLLALSNPLIENVHVQTSGTDGLLTATTGAAPAVLIAGNTDYEHVSNTVTIFGLHLERNNGCDLQIAPGNADPSYAEFVRLFFLHIEANIDNTGYALKNDPCLWLGNARGVELVAPQLYGGHGTLIYVNRLLDIGNTPMLGTKVFGGTLIGRQIASASNHVPDAGTPDRLVDLVAGDEFAMYGTKLDCAMVEGIRIGSAFGANVTLDIPPIKSRTDGASLTSSTTTVTDNRTGAVLPPQRNKSLAGTGQAALGGSVTTLAASGAARNTLDDGAGAASIAGALALLAGLRMVNRVVAATGGITQADMVLFAGTSTAITLTLSASSNQIVFVKNIGTANVVIAAPTTGTTPTIDGVASITLTAGQGALLSGRSLSIGSWITLLKA